MERLTSSSLATATVMLAGTATAIANPLYDSALVHYGFETLGAAGEVADSSANGVNLVTSGGDATLVSGAVGNGLHLPDPVVLTTTGAASDDSILNVTRDTPFTVAAWIKLENTTDRFYLASKVLREEEGDGDGLELKGWSFTADADGQLSAIWREDHTPTSGTAGDARIIVSTGAAITDTGWHHVALTFDYDEADATRGMRIYLDGVLQPMSASSTGLAGAPDIDLSHDSPFNISGRYDSQLNEGGSVDELAIWNTALSGDQVASLVPEPASLSLLALAGGVCLLRRQSGCR